MKPIDVMADDVALAAEILGSIEGTLEASSVAAESSQGLKTKKKKKKKVVQPAVAYDEPEDSVADSSTIRESDSDRSPAEKPFDVDTAPKIVDAAPKIVDAAQTITASNKTAPKSLVASSGPLFSEMVAELRAEAADFSELTHSIPPIDAEELEEFESEPEEGGEGAEEWTEDDSRVRFSDLGLPGEICSALEKSGYKYPTDIQSATIPALLKGRDVLGQAQTGTGKTAAFALPLLSGIDVENPETQVLVLAPTRELAIQVSESFMKYGQHLRGLRVAPIYGGSSYATQIHALKRGAHVVVGTPGRVMDHMRESRLRIDTLKCLVLDEADEMLRMGFVDDVQWILEQSPATRQIALFSATMPDPIRQIANRHLKNPHVISIESKQRTADNIEQRFITVEPRGRTEALQRILEAEDFDGMIVFVKTKIATVELSDHLRSLGYSAVALNGDIAQTQRERTIEQLKEGLFDILVATDVAARGLDVQRITHVINFDLPFDSEAYVHRIGRTGRAGRSGQAIIFIAPRQRGFLREIDRAAGQRIEPMAIPTSKEINALRVSRFKEKIQKAAAPTEASKEVFNLFEKLINDCVTEHGLSPIKIAAGLALLAQGERPFFVSESSERMLRMDSDRGRRERGGDPRDFRDSGRPARDRFGDREGFSGGDGRRGSRRGERSEGLDLGDPRREKETFRVEVGRIHGVKAGNLVGAVANEIGLNSDLIGQIKIHHDFSTIDLPAGMPREVFKTLGKAWVLGRQLRISKLMDHPSERRFSKEQRGAR